MGGECVEYDEGLPRYYKEIFKLTTHAPRHNHPDQLPFIGSPFHRAFNCRLYCPGCSDRGLQVGFKAGAKMG